MVFIKDIFIYKYSWKFTNLNRIIHFSIGDGHQILLWKLYTNKSIREILYHSSRSKISNVRAAFSLILKFWKENYISTKCFDNIDTHKFTHFNYCKKILVLRTITMLDFSTWASSQIILLWQRATRLSFITSRLSRFFYSRKLRTKTAHLRLHIFII